MEIYTWSIYLVAFSMARHADFIDLKSQNALINSALISGALKSEYPLSEMGGPTAVYCSANICSQRVNGLNILACRRLRVCRVLEFQVDCNR